MCAHGVSWDHRYGVEGGGGLWYSAVVITEPRVNISQSVPPLFDRNRADVVDSAELRAPCHVVSPPGNTGSHPLSSPMYVMLEAEKSQGWWKYVSKPQLILSEGAR